MSIGKLVLFVLSFIISQGKYVFGDGVCQTAGCFKSAELIRSNMDMNINPCEDFYEFACHGRIANAKSSNITFDNSFRILKELIFLQVREILSENATDNEIYPFRLAKQFFKDCIDEDTISCYGLEPIASKLKVLGGWPIAESSWNENEFSWIDAVYKSRNLGFLGNYILSLRITNLLNSSSPNVINIFPPDLAIPVQNLRRGLADIRVQPYFFSMVKYAEKFNVPSQKAQVELGSALEFEIELAKISPATLDKSEDLIKNLLPMTISEAQRRFPSIDWIRFIQSMLNPSAVVSESDNIVVAYPNFISNLQILLDSTSKRTLANYFLWRMLYSLDSYLIFPKGPQPRWKTCVEEMSTNLDVVLASMYVRRHFNDESKKSIVELSRNIKGRIHETLSSSHWMDETTKKFALEKLDTITENIGYPDILLDDEKIEEIYRGLIVQPGQYYESLLAIKRFDNNFNISTLNKPAKKNEWIYHISLLDVNAFYIQEENSIMIPMTVLQRNMFSYDRPNYLNYGAIGYIIGHEFLHAFDNQGSMYDKDGNYRDWWSSETKQKYYEKIQCFVDQYNNYSIDGTEKYVDGLKTLGENIADNEGIREAYRAYEVFVQNNGSEPALPGLDFTPRQLFWISAANVWCSKNHPGYFYLALSENEHAPDKNRVIGSFSNQREFARDFGCAVGSPMNPSKKCALWD